jgi:hypothetical protein
MIEFREGNAADRDAILALRSRCFPEDDPEKQDPAFWDWEFGNGGRVFVATDDGRVVAHLGFVPQTYTIAGESVRGMLAVDAMTDPQYRRERLFTQVAGRARDALRESVRISTAWQIRDAVLPGMTRNGWKPLLRAPVLVRPYLSSGVAGRPADRRPAAGGTADRLSALRRDREFIRWRFLDNPYWHYTVDANDDACVVTRRTMLRGYDTLAVADLGFRDMSAMRVLLREALARGREEGCRLAAALITLGHPALPLLVRAGFLPSPHRFRFLVNVFDEQLRVTRGKWALTWADTDHL